MKLYEPDCHNIDTFSLSYLVTLLGYDSRALADLINFDSLKVEELLKDEGDSKEAAMHLHRLMKPSDEEFDDVWYSIPPRGSSCEAVFKRKRSINPGLTDKRMVEGMSITSLDPLYLKLLVTYIGNPNVVGYPEEENKSDNVVTLKSAPQRLDKPKDADSIFFSFSTDMLAFLKKCEEKPRTKKWKPYDIGKVNLRLGVTGDEAAILKILKHTKNPNHIQSFYTETKIASILLKGTKSVADFVILCCDKKEGKVY